MFLVDLLLSALVNGLLGLKITLLVAAVILFLYGMTTRKQATMPVRRTKKLKRPGQRIDIHV